MRNDLSGYQTFCFWMMFINIHTKIYIGVACSIMFNTIGNRVQILVEAVCISHSINTLSKGMYTTILLLVMINSSVEVLIILPVSCKYIVMFLVLL